jgi:hypothetical protein
LVPDGAREQTLHAIGPLLFGVFSDLPAIFARNVTEHSLQIEQGMTAWFGAREVGRQALMQMA